MLKLFYGMAQLVCLNSLNFRKGTEIISHAIANSDAFSIAGGGDTLAAIDFIRYCRQDLFTFQRVAVRS